MAGCKTDFLCTLLSCYRLGLFFYIFTRTLPGLLSTCKFLSSSSFVGCQFDNFNIYLLHLETFLTTHLFLPPGVAKAKGPLGLASMQLPVFPESAYCGNYFSSLFAKNFLCIALTTRCPLPLNILEHGYKLHQAIVAILLVNY